MKPWTDIKKKKELRCLRHYASWNPVAADEFIASIDSKLAAEANVDVKIFQEARQYIKLDGWYGPISSEVWEEEQGGTLTKDQAMDIIDKALAYQFEDIEYNDPDGEFWHTEKHSVNISTDSDECNCIPLNAIISGKLIHTEVWSWYRKIYG